MLRIHDFTTRDRIEATIAEHRAIAGAVVARATEHAIALMRAHVEASVVVVEQRVAALLARSADADGVPARAASASTSTTQLNHEPDRSTPMTRPRSRPIVATAASLAVLVLATLLAACGSEDTTSGSSERTIKVATLRQPHLFVPDFYARFLPAGTKVEVVTLANSTEIKNAVVSGSADFGVTGITSALQGAAQGEPFRVLASAADGGSAIVAGKGSGIDSVADLRGKKIGYVPGSAQDILLRLTLRAKGIDAEKDTTLVKVEFPDMANALQRGDIDAFSGAETGPSDALVRASATLVTHPYDTEMAKINIVLGTSQKMIDSDPELVQTVVETHAKAIEYMTSHKAEWAAAVVKKYGFPKASLDMAIRNIELRWAIDDAYTEQAAVLGQQLKALKQIRNEPDYDAFFNRTFVDKVTTAEGAS